MAQKTVWKIAKEVESNTVAVRSRKQGDMGSIAVEEFIATLLDEIASKRK